MLFLDVIISMHVAGNSFMDTLHALGRGFGLVVRAVGRLFGKPGLILDRDSLYRTFGLYPSPFSMLLNGISLKIVQL
jgi:hypothetical protein